MKSPREVARLLVDERRRLTLVAILVATLLLGAAAPSVELSTSLEQFRGGTEPAAADSYVEREMSGSVAGVEQSLLVVRNTNESAGATERNVLTEEGYLTVLRIQERLLANETVNRTLVAEQRPISMANAVAIIAIREQQGVSVDEMDIEPRPPLSEQKAALRNISEYQRRLYTTYAIGEVLSDPEHTWPDGGGFAFVPLSYEGNGKTAPATGIVLSHDEDTDPKNLTTAQLTAQRIAADELSDPERDALIIGNGIINAELRQSSLDSLTIVGPLALLLMVFMLLFAYRDLVDAGLGLLGVGMVQVWTFGFMGWMDITFNQLFVAVPVLLMGLSVDYAIHVFMRHREERPPDTGGESDRRSAPRSRGAAADGGTRDTARTDGGRPEDDEAADTAETDDEAADTEDEEGGFVFGDDAFSDPEEGSDGEPEDGADTSDAPDDPAAGPDGAADDGDTPDATPTPGESDRTAEPPAGPGSTREPDRTASGGGRDPDPPGGRSGATGGPFDDITDTMTVGLAGVGTALALVTLTTATGFLANLTSGVGPIREFGVVSAVGIVAALVVFGAFIPALKVEVDRFLEARGHDRRKAAFGTQGRFESLLGTIVTFAHRTPWLVVGVALLATFAGIAGATQVSNQFEQDDLLVDDGDVPGWADDLPPAFQPANYTAQENLDYVEEEGFIYDGTFTQYVIRGDVTQDAALDRAQRAGDRVNDTGVVLQLPDETYATQTPVRLMNTVASRNETFARVKQQADTDGDGIPDRNIEAVYDTLYRVAPEAAPTMVAREDGEYVALRVKIPVNGTYSESTITERVRNASAPVQGNGLRTVPTGQPIKNQAVAAQLLSTVNTGLLLTLSIVLVILMLVYRRTEGYPSLGVVTLLPITFALAWILGTMFVLDIPFNVMTALITSFTIGIGVDYAIHLSERYMQELHAQGDMGAALETAVLGSGGAMLGSAITDIAGVGVLAFAILVPLQQFGIITALTIAYSFIGAVVVLPALLVLWTRRYGPDEVRGGTGASRSRSPEPMSVDD
ncbi:MMPL family transporter [Haloglomus halophilum]|uniref:MMPL family transporter n=1 Tax=Haloglomus halophilum TaxID=2962672 RepID=UPI0020C96B3F|nr:MMPL family transporter [Haloglomus halophilum]